MKKINRDLYHVKGDRRAENKFRIKSRHVQECGRNELRKEQGKRREIHSYRKEKSDLMGQVTVCFRARLFQRFRTIIQGCEERVWMEFDTNFIKLPKPAEHVVYNC